PGTVMRRDGLRDAIKLEEDGALIEPAFIDARRQPAREETAPCRLKCRASEPGICSESFLVADRAVHGNPICFSHGFRSLHVNVNRLGGHDLLKVKLTGRTMTPDRPRGRILSSSA